MNTETCANCFYGLPIESSEDIQCRRYPPTLHLVEANLKPYHPANFPNAWCGEYAGKSRSVDGSFIKADV
jgi:hypothetical protein